MKRLVVTTLLAVAAGGAVLDAGESGKQKKPKDSRQAVARADSQGSHIDIHLVFGAEETRLIRTHYAPRYRNLPPGLHKKLRRGGKLPPGWQKKFEPFPVALERQLPPLPTGYRRGVIDGHAVIYSPGTQVMIDVAVLF
jgi:hypothetical protein